MLSTLKEQDLSACCFLWTSMQLIWFGVNDAGIQQKQLPWQQKQTCNSTLPCHCVIFLEALTPRFAKPDFVTCDNANNGQREPKLEKAINTDQQMDFSSSLPPSHMDVFCQTPLSWKVLATIACLRLDILLRQEPHQMTSHDFGTARKQCRSLQLISISKICKSAPCWNSLLKQLQNAMELEHRPASSISSSCVHAWVVIGLGNGIHDLVGSGQKTRQYVWSSPLILYPTYIKYHEIHTSHRSSSLCFRSNTPSTRRTKQQRKTCESYLLGHKAVSRRVTHDASRSCGHMCYASSKYLRTHTCPTWWHGGFHKIGVSI